MKSGFLDKLIERLDRVSPEEVQTLVSRLVREKGFLENVFEALREGVLILDPTGVLTFGNRAALGMFGLHETHFQGQSIDHLVRGFDWEALARPDRVVSRDMEIFYPENRILNFYLSPIHSDVSTNGTEHIGYVMLVHDETDARREAEAELESEKLNALTLLAAGVAHEIGNPLNSIDIHLQLLARKVKKLPEDDQAGLLNHLQTAQSEIRRLDGILKQFLSAVRPTTPTKEKASIHEILHTTISSIETELMQRNVKVALNLSQTTPLLNIDKDQVQQALYNLLRNAAQALPASGGNISIITETTPYEVKLSIADNGTGISPEHMGSLFEPYQTTKKSGTGLGLLIVRRIIREQGGEIEIDSEEGKGTTVTLFFPREEKHLRLLERSTPDTVIDVDTTI